MIIFVVGGPFGTPDYGLKAEFMKCSRFLLCAAVILTGLLVSSCAVQPPRRPGPPPMHQPHPGPPPRKKSPKPPKPPKPPKKHPKKRGHEVPPPPPQYDPGVRPHSGR